MPAADPGGSDRRGAARAFAVTRGRGWPIRRDASAGGLIGCESAHDSRGASDHIHADERSTRDSALDTLVPVNRSLAKTLLALTYPLRLTAHLTDSAPHRDHAPQCATAGHPAISSEPHP